VDKRWVNCGEIVDGPSCTPVIAICDMGLQEQRQFLKGGDIYAVRAGRCGPTYADIDIADIRPEQVGDGCLHECSPTVVGTRDVGAAGLRGDVYGAAGALHGDRRLGGIVVT